MVSIPLNIASRFDFSKRLGRLPTVLNVLLVILLGYLTAALAVSFLPKSQSAMAVKSPVSTERKASTIKGQQQVGKVVAQSHLFGRAGTTKKPEVQKTENAPVTQLNLSLQGVLAFTPPEMAMAIIRPDNKEEKIYGIDDEIVSNVTLKEVHADRVIISRAGKLETLQLPEKMDSFQVKSAPRTSSSRPRAAERATKPTPQNLEKLSSNPGELRAELVKNPAMLTQLVTTKPYRQDGKLLGYKIQPKHREDILQSHGLQAGDVITQVNGIPINSSQRGLQALRKLVKAEAIDLVVLRNGAEIPLSISLQ